MVSLDLPTYSDFYKFKILEEISLERDINKIHYGKCSIIGFLSSADCLQSISIPSLDEQYQLPDCKISLKLFSQFHPKSLISSTVEVLGEVRLYDPDLEISYENMQSSYTLINNLIEMKTNLEASNKAESQIMQIINDEIENIKLTYMPVIQVESIRTLSDAREIIIEKLKYRLLQKKRNEMLQRP